MSQKQLPHSVAYYAIFDKNRTGGVISPHPPLRVKGKYLCYLLCI